MIDLDSLDLAEPVAKAVRDLESDVEIERYSGKGANGYLFFGRNKISDQQVAIKFYYWGSDRGHDEPRLLGELNSDHVIPILHANFVDDEWAMFHTPYYHRGDIDQVIQRGTLSLYQAIDHTIEILDGVSALHGAGLLHRDLKPANIFIDDEGRARIGDFGSVIVVPDGATTVTGSGHSVLYRPPEAFGSGEGEYGYAGDIYQCGIILYQLASGALPYQPHQVWLDRKGKRCWAEAEDEIERSRCVDASIKRRAKKARLLDLASLPGTVPKSLKSAIRKATRPHPKARFANSSEFIVELRRIRSICLDWRWNGEEAAAEASDRLVRIVRERGGRYRAQSDKGQGWRKMSGVDDGALADVVAVVDTRLV